MGGGIAIEGNAPRAVVSFVAASPEVPPHQPAVVTCGTAGSRPANRRRNQRTNVQFLPGQAVVVLRVESASASANVSGMRRAASNISGVKCGLSDPVPVEASAARIRCEAACTAKASLGSRLLMRDRWRLTAGALGPFLLRWLCWQRLS